MSITPPKVQDANVALLKGEALYVDPYRQDLITLLHTRVSVARIDTVWSDDWVNTTTGRIFTAITIQNDEGPGPDTGPRSIPYTAQARSLIRCWASFLHDAEAVAYLVSRILLPDEPGLPSNFIGAGTYIEACLGITQPGEYREPGTKYQNAFQMRATQRYRRRAVT